MKNSTNTLPKVTLFLLGGTITMVAKPKEMGVAKPEKMGVDKPEKSDSDAPVGVVPTLTAQDLCNAVGGLKEKAGVTTRTERMVASANLTYEDAFWLVEEITAIEQAGTAHGIVIIQGTDTLEEMAFILDCLLEASFPVIVTGAMRSPNMAGAEGPANILASVIAATSDDLKHQGVMVVMNDDIHAARRVTKSHTGDVAAFKSLNGGIVGRVVEGDVRLFNKIAPRPRLKAGKRGMPERNHSKSLKNDSKIPKIALLKASFGDEGHLLNIIETSDFDGLVIEGFGAGHVPESWLETLSILVQKIPVILSSRTAEGHVYQKTYGYEGAEIDLIQRGLIPSGIFSGLQSKIMLGLLLRANKQATAPEIRDYFECLTP